MSLKECALTSAKKCITSFSDNSPTVSWVTRLASKQSLVVEQLVQAPALCLKTMHARPLTPMHIKGKCNTIANVLSRSFGSNPAWTCTSDSDLLTLFNTCFLLPSKQSWTVYRLNYTVVMRMICTLRMKPFVLDDWRRLPTRGRCVGKIGALCQTHLGVDLYLQQVPYATQVQYLTGFAARTQTGFYGHGQQVQSSTVTGYITAIGQTVALACNKNPSKVLGSEKFLPALQIMLDDYTKADPPTQKKLPVKADVPKLLIKMGYGKLGSVQAQAIMGLVPYSILLPLTHRQIYSKTTTQPYEAC
jgi:hypothetical protein